MVIAIERQLLAGAVPTAPEIDGSLISAGLGLLAGGILILRSRRRSK
jgi:LPXTG-motif cell wall-anchored protein